jgi:hypothetical protein
MRQRSTEASSSIQGLREKHSFGSRPFCLLSLLSFLCLLCPMVTTQPSHRNPQQLLMLREQRNHVFINVGSGRLRSTNNAYPTTLDETKNFCPLDQQELPFQCFNLNSDCRSAATNVACSSGRLLASPPDLFIFLDCRDLSDRIKAFSFSDSMDRIVDLFFFASKPTPFAIPD